MEDTLTQFLHEIKASRKSKSVNQIVNRIQIERTFGNRVEKLRGEGYNIHENIIDKEIDYDYIIRKGMCEVLLFLLDEDKKYIITRQQIEKYIKTLSKSNISEAICLVWLKKPLFYSIVLTYSELYKLFRKEINDYSFLNQVTPFEEKIRTYFLVRLKSFKYSVTKVPEMEKVKIVSIFKKYLIKEFEKEKKI